MKIENASIKPQRYYGLHMVEGVAEYRDPGKDPYRILINENTIKSMDETFNGCPVYVHHVDGVDYSNFQQEADGVVVKSFYNKSDGKHWAEFIVFTDRAEEAIKMKKWKLSNAYIPKQQISGGQWHGVDYQKEVVQGEYEHLAIVPDPRYAESIILTPEEFKTYNNEKEIELTRLANSKGASMLSFFKKTKIENSQDLEAMSVTLPKSKVEKTISQLISETDEMLANPKLSNAYVCNGDERVKVGDKEMSVNDLVTKHLELSADSDPMHENSEESDKDESEKKKKDMMLEEGEKKNDSDMDDEAMDNEKDKKDMEDCKSNESDDEKKKEEDKKKNAKENFEKIKNAQAIAAKSAPKFELSEDKVARGQSRYGSN